MEALLPNPTPFTSQNLPPDWNSITDDAFCPLCNYNLRGLTEPRCPECGHRFAWKDLIAPDGMIYPFLFEHQPRRNLASFFATVGRTEGGQRFWTTLRPEHTVRVGRLILYGLLVVLPACLPWAVLIAAIAQRFLNDHFDFGWVLPDRLQEISNFLNFMLSRPGLEQYLLPSLGFGTLLAAFPLINVLVLHIFLQSMHQARIRSIHLLRCAIYCSDFVFWQFSIWLALVLLNLGCFEFPLWTPRPGSLAPPTLCVLSILFPLAIVNARRLTFAYRNYLCFPRSNAVVAASTLIVVLAYVAVLFNFLV